MPTGFDVETGSNLSQKLAEIAPRLAEYLKRCRIAGKVTPDSPVTAADLCDVINSREDAGAKVQGPDIRAMVNYLRRSKAPIGSGANGYFWATDIKELGPTIVHMMERRDAIQSAITGLESSFEPRVSGQMSLF
ncbi:MAG: hypothetical protein EKK55_17325 [Rhodocyclaceae bacterium]|nr:MAG: hypothetical protein EKK55_17325 [Rhodocyclaceae bacterium]